MAIPLRYTARSLFVRWRSTLGTVLGVGLVVGAYLFIMALARGLESTFVETGDPRNLMVLRKGSTAESSSQISLEEVRRIRYRSGIARDAAGQPLASAEILVLINLDRSDGSGAANVLIRGLEPVGLALRRQLNIVQGRMFQPGLRECIVSRKVSERFVGCALGQQFRTGRTQWKVVGIFEANRTAFESEIWVNADEAREVFKRDFYGAILLRPADEQITPLLNTRDQAETALRQATDSAAGLQKKIEALNEQPAGPWRNFQLALARWRMPEVAATRARRDTLDQQIAASFIGEIERDKQLSVRILSEQAYYDEQTKTSTGPIRIFGTFVSVVMSIGAIFAAMNTMYAAVGGRTREIGTLRVLGYKRRSIYAAFLLESVLLAGLGGLLGCSLALLWNGVSTGTMSFATFSEVAFEFQVTRELLLQALGFALIMGFLGGLLPARQAARKPVLDALRSV